MIGPCLDNRTLEEVQQENLKLRLLLFYQHGSDEHHLYGDDGVMHCNTCWIDFLEDSADVIQQKIQDYNVNKLARCLPPDVNAQTADE